ASSGCEERFAKPTAAGPSASGSKLARSAGHAFAVRCRCRGGSLRDRREGYAGRGPRVDRVASLARSDARTDGGREPSARSGRPRRRRALCPRSRAGGPCLGDAAAPSAGPPAKAVVAPRRPTFRGYAGRRSGPRRRPRGRDNRRPIRPADHRGTNHFNMRWLRAALDTNI
ncbi:unnamed protein product, partial [Ixodes persulcatus]